MGISINVTTDTWKVDNLDWLAARKGLDTCRPATLLLSLFTAGGLGIVDAAGFIPSGTVLGRVTASGLVGPYSNAAADGRQTAIGHLLHGTRVRDSEGNAFTTAAVAFLWEGIVLEDKLPAFTGTEGEIDAAGKADLPMIRYETVATP